MKLSARLLKTHLIIIFFLFGTKYVFSASKLEEMLKGVATSRNTTTTKATVTPPTLTPTPANNKPKSKKENSEIMSLLTSMLGSILSSVGKMGEDNISGTATNVKKTKDGHEVTYKSWDGSEGKFTDQDASTNIKKGQPFMATKVSRKTSGKTSARKVYTTKAT